MSFVWSESDELDTSIYKSQSPTSCISTTLKVLPHGQSLFVKHSNCTWSSNTVKINIFDTDCPITFSQRYLMHHLHHQNMFDDPVHLECLTKKVWLCGSSLKQMSSELSGFNIFFLQWHWPADSSYWNCEGFWLFNLIILLFKSRAECPFCDLNLMKQIHHLENLVTQNLKWCKMSNEQELSGFNMIM